VDGIKTSVTGKVNNNIDKEFRVKIYEAESGITYPLLLFFFRQLLYYNTVFRCDFLLRLSCAVSVIGFLAIVPAH